jgi:hypothetical protein
MFALTSSRTLWADGAVREDTMSEQQRDREQGEMSGEEKAGKEGDYTRGMSRSDFDTGGNADNDGGTSGDYTGGASGDMQQESGATVSRDDQKDMSTSDQSGKSYMGGEGAKSSGEEKPSY